MMKYDNDKNQETFFNFLVKCISVTVLVRGGDNDESRWKGQEEAVTKLSSSLERICITSAPWMCSTRWSMSSAVHANIK